MGDPVGAATRQPHVAEADHPKPKAGSGVPAKGRAKADPPKPQAGSGVPAKDKAKADFPLDLPTERSGLPAPSKESEPPLDIPTERSGYGTAFQDTGQAPPPAAC
jgi:hypothetical protein